MAVAGCAAPGGISGGGSGLKLGVLSDLHVTDWDSTACFRKALRYYRGLGVDAVLIAGDLTDHGILPQLENVARAWYEVFPDDRGTDGRKVEKLFVYGNHDCEGLGYRDEAMENSLRATGITSADAERLALGRLGFAECWERCFREPYAPIYVKRVRGVDFVGAHWAEGSCDWSGVYALEDWWKRNSGRLATDRPFFYIQHAAPRGTVYGADSWGDDSGQSVRCLRDRPYAVAVSGHSHLPLTDGRFCWRGEFTSISASSLSYMCFPEGRENPVDYRKNLGCRHGMVIGLRGDRLDIVRRDFTHDEPLAPDVAFELPVRASAFAERAVVRDGVPAFAEDAEVKSVREGDVITVSFPGAFANPSATPFEYLVSVVGETADGCTERTESRWFQSEVCFSRERAAGSVNSAAIPVSKLPKSAVRASVRVVPCNCYGGSGDALVSDVVL